MGWRLADQRGGIYGLVDLVDEFETAVNADLVDRGLRLRDAGCEAFDLCDLRDVVRNLPPDSATVRAMRDAEFNDDPERAAAELWGIQEHLLADIADSLRWLVWSKTKDARRRGAQPPDPIPRPGVEQRAKKHRPRTSIPIDVAIRTQRFAVPRT